MSNTIPAPNTQGTEEAPQPVQGQFVCPFCGAIRQQADGVCARCTMDSSGPTLQTTKQRIGPWYVLQSRNPAAPGMKYETLVAFIQKGRVKPQSIVRGPTTHQLWKFAANVRGLSREFGVCYSCGKPVTREQTLCSNCNRSQTLPANPDVFLEHLESSTASGEAPIPLVGEDIGSPRISMNTQGVASNGGSQPAAFGSRFDSRPKKGDGFLTTADLATAFKLEVDPKNKRRSRKTTVAPIGEDAESYSTNRPPRRRRWFRWVVLFLLLAAIGAGVYQFQHDGKFHDMALMHFDQAVAWIKQHAVELQKQGSDRTKPGSSDASHTGTGTDGAATPDLRVPNTPPSTQPAGGPQNPWDRIYNDPAGDKSAKPPASKDEQPASINEVRTLYRAAIDAEAAGDFATAVKKYQEIKNYPAELWPGDLELRLKLARQVSH